MKEKKTVRKKVLSAHYELSDANIWKPVLRSEVAERLVINNDEGLLGAITYLEEKGYLSATDNIADQITALGIDEVEAGYPSFPAV